MPTHSIAQVYNDLVQDPARVALPFSTEVAAANTFLLQATDDGERMLALGDWLQRHQPCIFGRLAAERQLISYCFLDETDLLGTDQHIQSKLQTARRTWKLQAADGRRSAFVILTIAPRLITAAPDQRLMRFAIALCSAYLRRPILPDTVYQDSLELWDIAFRERRRWRVGVNFFSPQGDQRWWNDHRIPGGIGFSMNSVGHLVASEARREAIRAAAHAIATGTTRPRLAQRAQAEADLAALQRTSVDSLERALRFAMHTIRNASVPPCGGPATMLLRASPGERCPFPEIGGDPRLSSMDFSTYAGWYHTDVTVPSEYFLQEVERPLTIREPYSLDFTYLHAGRGSDFQSLARGIKVKERVSK